MVEESNSNDSRFSFMPDEALFIIVSHVLGEFCDSLSLTLIPKKTFLNSTSPTNSQNTLLKEGESFIAFGYK
jgi:hypothetical protein